MKLIKVILLYISATFPLKTRLSLYIAIFRVYPRLREYISAKGLCAYPAIEFYSQDQIQVDKIKARNI